MFMKIKEDNKKSLIKKSLRYSILDGTFASMMVGFGESFFSAFAVFLKANNIQLGLLGSLPQMIGSLSQLFSNRLINFLKSRKRLVCISALLQGLMYIPIALVFFFGTFKVFHLILFVCLYWIFGMMLSPAWNSWMGELVDSNKRGSYFGIRNKITGFASFLTLLIGGYILQNFTNGVMMQYVGFAVIFSLALVSRIMSFIFLTKKYEPGYDLLPESDFTFSEIARSARFTNYRSLMLYLGLTNFAVFLSAPFFVAYMLYDLKMSYMTFTIVNAAAAAVKLVAMPVWGKVSDQFGTRKVISLAGFLMPVVPVLWLFSGNIFYLVLIQMFSGFVWAGFELSSFNFIFDVTDHRTRAKCVSYFNMFSGVLVFLGAVIGSLIVRYNDVFWSKYLLVFLISFAVRYVVAFIFIPKLREVRQVDGIPYTKLFFKIVTMMPTVGPVYHLITFKRNHKDDYEKIK